MAAKAKKFEEELKNLEEVVGRIDSGELTLEESIAAFERGVALVRSLNRKLDEAERKVFEIARLGTPDVAPIEKILTETFERIDFFRSKSGQPSGLVTG